MRNLKSPRELLGLGSLARTLRPEQNNSETGCGGCFHRRLTFRTHPSSLGGQRPIVKRRLKTFVIAHHELGIDLFDRLDYDGYNDQQACSADDQRLEAGYGLENIRQDRNRPEE